MKVKNNRNKFKNKNLISNRFDVSNYFIHNFEEGWAIIIDRTTNKYGWINKHYNRLIEPIFNECDDFQEGFAKFNKNGKEGWIDTSGKVLAEGFYWCWSFKNEFAVFKKNNKWGWIDKNGKVLAEGFDSCYDFEEGFAKFQKDNEFGLIDENGKIYT